MTSQPWSDKQLIDRAINSSLLANHLAKMNLNILHIARSDSDPLTLRVVVNSIPSNTKQLRHLLKFVYEGKELSIGLTTSRY